MAFSMEPTEQKMLSLLEGQFTTELSQNNSGNIPTPLINLSIAQSVTNNHLAHALNHPDDTWPGQEIDEAIKAEAKSFMELVDDFCSVPDQEFSMQDMLGVIVSDSMNTRARLLPEAYQDQYFVEVDEVIIKNIITTIYQESDVEEFKKELANMYVGNIGYVKEEAKNWLDTRVFRQRHEDRVKSLNRALVCRAVSFAESVGLEANDDIHRTKTAKQNIYADGTEEQYEAMMTLISKNDTEEKYASLVFYNERLLEGVSENDLPRHFVENLKNYCSDVESGHDNEQFEIRYTRTIQVNESDGIEFLDYLEIQSEDYNVVIEENDLGQLLGYTHSSGSLKEARQLLGHAFTVQELNELEIEISQADSPYEDFFIELYEMSRESSCLDEEHRLRVIGSTIERFYDTFNID